jgi:branched-chain amino acid transport system ATP-binding protein
MALLEIHDLHTRYGSIEALRGVSFNVEAGQVVSLIGANGAGKTTTLNSISGVLKPNQGRIIFDGKNITGWRSDRVTGLGLVQVPEGRQIVSTMTVLENLQLGAYPRKDRASIGQDLENIFARFTRLRERRDQKAGSLSGGEQQMLAVGRALMSRPRLLMLDEPSMGLAPMLINEIFKIVSDIKAQGIPILLVEQNARKALQIADYAYVLEIGTVVHQGKASELQNDPRIVSAYLG